MAARELQQIEFGEFILDLERGSLQRSGKDVGLRRQAFDVLTFLATRRGTLVSRDELQNAVWDEVKVTDNSLTQCIVEIRKAIDDHTRTVIRTVPRRGFIFEPPATPSAARPAERVPAAAERSGENRKYWMAGITVVSIFVLAIVALLPMVGERPTPVDDGARLPNSIAVLPFADMSEAGDQQYFGDGMAEEILTKLTEYPDLRVTARTSSFRFRDRQDDVTEIGRSLNVAYVLEGSIRKSGSQIRITAQLIETRDGTHDWSQTFDRDLSSENLLEIQAEVAMNVAETIGTSAPRLSSRAGDRDPANVEAYDSYLEGLFYFEQIRNAPGEVDDPDVYAAAVERFEASIREDPDWPKPYVALARTLQFRAALYMGHEDEKAYELLRTSKAHVLDAIRIEPDYALAYSSLGHVLLHLDFDFPAAAAAYDRARELGDYVPWAYAAFLAAAGRFDEAIVELKLEIERDPMSLGARRLLAGMYRCAGRNADSIVALEEFLRMAPGRVDLYIPLAYLYAQAGDRRKGRALIEQHTSPEINAIRYGPAYAMLGMTEKAYEVLEGSDRNVRWWLEAAISTALVLGETDRALDLIDAATKDDPRRLIHLHRLYGIEKLIGNPRYARLLEAAGIPDAPH